MQGEFENELARLDAIGLQVLDRMLRMDGVNRGEASSGCEVEGKL